MWSLVEHNLFNRAVGSWGVEGWSDYEVASKVRKQGTVANLGCRACPNVFPSTEKFKFCLFFLTDL